MSDKNWPAEVLAMMARIKHGHDCKCVCARDGLIAVVMADAIQKGVVAAAMLDGPPVLRTLDGGLTALKVLKEAQPKVPGFD
jgi:hypothetical protein